MSKRESATPSEPVPVDATPAQKLFRWGVLFKKKGGGFYLNIDQAGDVEEVRVRGVTFVPAARSERFTRDDVLEALRTAAHQLYALGKPTLAGDCLLARIALEGNAAPQPEEQREHRGSDEVAVAAPLNATPQEVPAVESASRPASEEGSLVRKDEKPVSSSSGIRDSAHQPAESASRCVGAAQQWIPVSEKLPPVNVPVVAHWYFKNTDFYECPDVIACYDGRIWHNPDDTDDDYSAPACWLALPSPPERPSEK